MRTPVAMLTYIYWVKIKFLVVKLERTIKLFKS